MYRSYASGRPKLLVAGIDEGDFHEPGELLLIRLPDRAHGRGVVLDRLALDAGAMELSFVRVLDPRDIAVQLRLKHPPQGVTVRVVGSRLKEIADVLATPGNVADLDRDGIPEIILGFEPGAGACGMRGSPGILRWNGTQYRPDGKHYAAWAEVQAGPNVEKVGFEGRSFVPDAAQQQGCVLRLFPQPGVRRVTVTIDGKPVVVGKTVFLDSACHTMTVRASGRTGAIAYVFLEERTSRHLPAMR